MAGAPAHALERALLKLALCDCTNLTLWYAPQLCIQCHTAACQSNETSVQGLHMRCVHLRKHHESARKNSQMPRCCMPLVCLSVITPLQPDLRYVCNMYCAQCATKRGPEQAVKKPPRLCPPLPTSMNMHRLLTDAPTLHMGCLFCSQAEERGTAYPKPATTHHHHNSRQSPYPCARLKG